MSTSPKKRRFSESPDAPAESSGSGCCAHNCPLTGTISLSTTGGGGSWRCWAHDRVEEPGQWPYLTQGINENLWLFKIADRVMTLPLYDLERKQTEITAYLEVRGRPELARMKNDGSWSERVSHEPRFFWVGRLKNAAYKAAFDYVDHHWIRQSA